MYFFLYNIQSSNTSLYKNQHIYRLQSIITPHSNPTPIQQHPTNPPIHQSIVHPSQLNISPTHNMQGGLFGLTITQKTYLYLTQLLPTLIIYLNTNLLSILTLLQLFYLISSILYIKFLSIEKQLYPYLFYENHKIQSQKQKGFSLAVSAFLLITIYGVLFLKIGKLALPHTIHLGDHVLDHTWALILLLLVNAFLQQCFWRLFLPKTFQQHYQKNYLIFTTYLFLHLMLFYKYLGFWRSLPLVTMTFSLGRSMSHIKSKFGFWTAVITHYGITLAGFTLFLYIKWFTDVKIV